METGFCKYLTKYDLIPNLMLCVTCRSQCQNVFLGHFTYCTYKFNGYLFTPKEREPLGCRSFASQECWEMSWFTTKQKVWQVLLVSCSVSFSVLKGYIYILYIITCLSWFPFLLSCPDYPVFSIIGTSSLRRAAQLKKRFPHLEFKDIVSF